MNPQNYIIAIMAFGVTRKELAGMLDCSLSTIQMIIDGRRGKNTAYWLVERLAEILRQLENSSKLPNVKK